MRRTITIKNEEGEIVDVVVREIKVATKGKLKGKEYILYKSKMHSVYKKRDNKYYARSKYR